jgi:hypothetical protein
VLKADNLTTILCRCRAIWKPLGHTRPVTGLLFMFQGVSSSQNPKSHKQIMLPIFPPPSRIFIFNWPSAWTVQGLNPGGGEIFRTHPDRSGAHRTSYKMGTGSFSGAKRSGRGVNHHPYLAPRLKETVQLYICSPSESLWPVRRGTLPALRTSILQCSVSTMCVFLHPKDSHNLQCPLLLSMESIGSSKSGSPSVHSMFLQEIREVWRASSNYEAY